MAIFGYNFYLRKLGLFINKIGFCQKIKYLSNCWIKICQERGRNINMRSSRVMMKILNGDQIPICKELLGFFAKQFFLNNSNISCF